MRSISTFIQAASPQGQFLRLPRYDSGVNFGSFVQADIKLDGKTDIVGIRRFQPGSTSSEVTVTLGNGTGGFCAPINTPISAINKVLTLSSGFLYGMAINSDFGRATHQFLNDLRE